MALPMIPPTSSIPFSYTPLPQTNSIRVLTVLPDLAPTGHIQCTLQTTSTDTAYICLSYIWGPEEPSPPHIVLDTTLVPIRANLHAFLSTARARFANTPLWIDALCINQSDNEEKQVQVRAMGDIFAGANLVISWLGTDAKCTAFLTDVAANPKAYHTWQEFEDAECTRLQVPEGMVLGSTAYWALADAHREAQYALYQAKSIDLDLLHAFTKSEYWTRAWITQEVVMAQRVVLCTDATQLDYAVVMERPRFWQDRLPQQRFRGEGVIQLLNRYPGAKCYLKRDRIYSLFGMCEEKNVRVDYTGSDVDVLIQTMSCLQEQLCICSVAVLRRALELEETDGLDKQQRFELRMKPSPFDTCCKGRNDFPGGWRENKGTFFCLHSMCGAPHIAMHFFLTKVTSADYKLWSFTNTSVDEKYDKSAMGQAVDAAVEVEVQADESATRSGMYSMRFGLQVLLFLARMVDLSEHAEIRRHGPLLKFLC